MVFNIAAILAPFSGSEQKKIVLRTRVFNLLPLNKYFMFVSEKRAGKKKFLMMKTLDFIGMLFSTICKPRSVLSAHARNEQFYAVDVLYVAFYEYLSWLELAVISRDEPDRNEVSSTCSSVEATMFPQ